MDTLFNPRELGSSFPSLRFPIQWLLLLWPRQPRKDAMQILIPSDRIQQRVVELAQQIAGDYDHGPITIVGVLTGCLMFLSDLVRHLDLPSRIGLIQASSYRGPVTRPGQLHIQPDLLPDLRGRHVLLLDDILDTGQTLASLIQHLRTLDIASLRVVVLLRKQGRQQVPLQLDYCGFDIPDAFVVGYGLDFNDEYRHLPYIGVLEETSRLGAVNHG